MFYNYLAVEFIVNRYIDEYKTIVTPLFKWIWFHAAYASAASLDPIVATHKPSRSYKVFNPVMFKIKQEPPEYLNVGYLGAVYSMIKTPSRPTYVVGPKTWEMIKDLPEFNSMINREKRSGACFERRT